MYQSDRGLCCLLKPICPSAYDFYGKEKFSKAIFCLFFTVASLLNCLHQLKSENRRLEDYIQKLISRRDHLLAINARLSLPFTSPTDTLRVNEAVSSGEEGSEEVNVTVSSLPYLVDMGSMRLSGVCIAKLEAFRWSE